MPRNRGSTQQLQRNSERGRSRLHTGGCRRSGGHRCLVLLSTNTRHSVRIVTVCACPFTPFTRITYCKLHDNITHKAQRGTAVINLKPPNKVCAHPKMALPVHMHVGAHPHYLDITCVCAHARAHVCVTRLCMLEMAATGAGWACAPAGKCGRHGNAPAHASAAMMCSR